MIEHKYVIRNIKNGTIIGTKVNDPWKYEFDTEEEALEAIKDGENLIRKGKEGGISYPLEFEICKYYTVTKKG